MLNLRKLTIEDELIFLSGMEKWKGESLSWYTFDWKPGVSFKNHIERLDKNTQGVDLPVGHVPSSMLYGFVNNEIVGRVNIRHELNESLSARGGNIGYSVAPEYRKQGYATEMMEQTLLYCRGIALNKLLITCAVANIPSWRIVICSDSQGTLKKGQDELYFIHCGKF